MGADTSIYYSIWFNECCLASLFTGLGVFLEPVLLVTDPVTEQSKWGFSTFRGIHLYLNSLVNDRLTYHSFTCRFLHVSSVS